MCEREIYYKIKKCKLVRDLFDRSIEGFLILEAGFRFLLYLQSVLNLRWGGGGRRNGQDGHRHCDGN